MIKNIIINEFRLFEGIEFNLGRYLTVFAGRNATGKSTLLGMLGNSAELKKKDATPLIQDQFRTEFREIFKSSPRFDPSGSNKYRVNFGNENFDKIIDYRNFRISWQNNKTRFRIIPYRKLEDGKRTDGKKEWPMLYLGLSRLFPIGESNKDGIDSNQLTLNKKEKEWFVDKYKSILSLNDNMEDISSIDIGETNRKKGIGITTLEYNHLANSAGQDNLGQMLCAILSFKRLQEQKRENYTGGMLLIDEVDATLHPAAQNRLIDILIKASKRFNIQVVCTTHSISLLKYICRKTKNNKENINNNIELLYFTNANNKLQLLENPSFHTIKNELKISSIVQTKRKIKIYSEDEEARWFLRHLLNEYLTKVDLVDINLGYHELLRLREADIKYFSNVLFVLDGDVKNSEIEKSISLGKSKLNNIIKLPGSKRPEEIFYDYILNLSSDHIFWKEGLEDGFTKAYFNDKGPEEYEGKEREKFKKWFNEHEPFLESLNLFDYWEHDNVEQVNKFKEEFKRSFNEIAYRLFIPKIK